LGIRWGDAGIRGVGWNGEEKVATLHEEMINGGIVSFWLFGLLVFANTTIRA
jgi:hypothetical protein